MKTIISKHRKGFFSIGSLMIIVVVFLFSSCTMVGDDGDDGRAYLALSYSIDEPDYVDVGTSSVPEIFFWDECYRVHPGVYTLYYDGVRFAHGDIIDYAWEIDYEIYILRGENGGIGYNGDDGDDMYFTLECNPFGPTVYEESYSKSSTVNGMNIISVSDDEIVMQKEKDGFGIRITYRKVEKR